MKKKLERALVFAEKQANGDTSAPYMFAWQTLHVAVTSALDDLRELEKTRETVRQTAQSYDADENYNELLVAVDSILAPAQTRREEIMAESEARVAAKMKAEPSLKHIQEAQDIANEELEARGEHRGV